MYLQIHKRADENSMHSPRAPFTLVCDVQAGASHLPSTCTHTCLSSYLWVVLYLYLYDVFSQPAENDFYSPEMYEVGTTFTCGSWIFSAFHTCDRTCKYWTFSFWPTVEIIKLVTFRCLPVLNKWNRERSTMAIKWCEQLTTIPIIASVSQDDMRPPAISVYFCCMTDTRLLAWSGLAIVATQMHYFFFSSWSIDLSCAWWSVLFSLLAPFSIHN